MIGWLILTILVASLVFVVVGLADLHYLASKLKSLNSEERNKFWHKRLLFFHISPQKDDRLDGSVDGQFEGDIGATAVTEEIDECLRNKRPFRFSFRNMIVSNGLPPKDSINEKLVIFHICGAWTGLFPHNPYLNRRLSGHAMPLRDVISRFTFLNLPYTVIGCAFPTDAVSALNFGGVDDQTIISLSLSEIKRHLRRGAKILVSGDCLGGLRFLKWSTNNSNHPDIAGAFLEGPLPTMDRICRPYKNPVLNEFIFQLFQFVLPNFDGRANKNKTSCPWPTLVTVVQKDGLCGEKDSNWIRRTFLNLRNLIVIPANERSETNREITHGMAFRATIFRNSLLSFSQNLS